MRMLLIGLLLLLSSYSCIRHERWRWKHAELHNVNTGQVVTIMSDDSFRYVLNGIHDKLPNSGYAKLDISSVSIDADELGICWKRDGYDWYIFSYQSVFINSDLDSSRFYIQKDTKFDDKGIPSIAYFYHEDCSMIMIREEGIRQKNELNTQIKYKGFR